MRSWIPPLSLSLALSLGSGGCFINDELNKGQDLMSQHAPKKSGAKEKTEEGESGISLDAIKEKGAGTIGQLSEKLGEAMKEEPDPENTIIRCEIDGRIQYTRNFDCMSLGGQVVMR